MSGHKQTATRLTSICRTPGHGQSPELAGSVVHKQARPSPHYALYLPTQQTSKNMRPQE